MSRDRSRDGSRETSRDRVRGRDRYRSRDMDRDRSRDRGHSRRIVMITGYSKNVMGTVVSLNSKRANPYCSILHHMLYMYHRVANPSLST